MIHRALTIEGNVQGVFFRASAKEKGDEFGIKGFVRNEPDGSVYIEAEGDDVSMQGFVSWCQKGPRHAHVTNVIIREGPLKNFSRFEILR